MAPKADNDYFTTKFRQSDMIGAPVSSIWTNDASGLE